MTLLSKLASVRHPWNAEREGTEYSCETCGRVFGNPIQLTILSATPKQIYSACPFCFSKLDDDTVLEELNDLKESTSENLNIVSGRNQRNIESPEHITCPHHFGYLKKRPKNVPIPDACLTCQKMIQCLF